MISDVFTSCVQEELAALERYRGQCTRPTSDLLEFFKRVTDGTMEGEDGIPPSSRVAAGFAIGAIHATAWARGMSGEDLVTELLGAEAKTALQPRVCEATK